MVAEVFLGVVALLLEGALLIYIALLDSDSSCIRLLVSADSRGLGLASFDNDTPVLGQRVADSLGIIII